MNRVATLIAAMTGVVLPNAVSADVLSEVKAKGKLVCGVLGVNEPFAWQDVQSRQIIGYEVDLCGMMAADLGVQPELKVVTSQSRIPELSQRRVDVLISLLTYTAERAQQVDFSNNYLTSSWKCMVLTDSKFQRLDDLAEGRVAVLKGSVLEAPFVARYPKAKVLSLDDTSTSMLALFQGKVDATCNNQVTVRLVALRTPNAEPTRLLPEAIMTATTGMAVKKGEASFVQYMNGFLDKIESNGQGQALFDKWMGSASKLELKRDYKFGSQNQS
jgi:polar amino acid transport system substrate-binding protein